MKIKREHRLKILSFLMAVTLWYFVVWGRSIEKTLEIPVFYKLPNSNYIVEVTPSTVVIKIQTIRNLLRNVNEKDLKLEIDFKNLTPGVHQIRVPIEKINLPSGIKVKEINPTFLTLIIKKIGTKKVPVRPVLKEESFYHTRGKIKVFPKYVLIKAPIEVLLNIQEINTEPIDFLKLKLTGSLEVDLMPPLGIISMDTEKVKVYYEEKKR